MASVDLAELRKKIDALDENLLELINRRADLAKRVAEAKIAAGEDDSFYRPEREAEILRRLASHNGGPVDSEGVARIFREIMSACLALERPLTVAFLGPEGTFTQQAALKHFGHSIRTSSLPSIDGVFREVASGACQYGVVPVENSTEGVISHTLDSFLESGLLICGEVVLRIHQSLLSVCPELSDIEEVLAHQQSLAQCRAWLDRYLPAARRTAVSSNAEAARLVAIMPQGAAIASEVAAELYQLHVVARNIEDHPENTTRFLVIGKESVGPSGDDKTSLLISTGNRPGALYKTLEPLALHGISMSRIESRPSRQGVWEYVFFVDIEGHQDEPTVASALADLRQRVSMVKILGSYPRAVI